MLIAEAPQPGAVSFEGAVLLKDAADVGVRGHQLRQPALEPKPAGPASGCSRLNCGVAHDTLLSCRPLLTRPRHDEWHTLVLPSMADGMLSCMGRAANCGCIAVIVAAHHWEFLRHIDWSRSSRHILQFHLQAPTQSVAAGSCHLTGMAAGLSLARWRGGCSWPTCSC